MKRRRIRFILIAAISCIGFRLTGAEKFITTQQVNFNGHYRGELGRWQVEHIIRSGTRHTITEPGIHTLRYRVLNPGIVLQKIVIDTGGLKPSYLGPRKADAGVLRI